jgi:hypothetical protein
MLRADNITCITVMLDPPGPPFSECILNKKKQMSLSTCKSFILLRNDLRNKLFYSFKLFGRYC